MPFQSQCQTNYIQKDYEYLKIKPESLKNLKKNYSQVWQDIFALVVNDGKDNGTFIEIGGGQPFIGNNTWLLEEHFKWRGFSIELESEFADMWDGKRPLTKMYKTDAINFDYVSHVDELNLPRHLDYLSIDLEPPAVTLECLKKFPFDKLKFNCITYEHDAYRQWGGEFDHRDIFYNNQYDLVGCNLRKNNCVMEEWYIHNDISNELRNKLRSYNCEAFELLLDL